MSTRENINSGPKESRLEARIPRALKALILRAASLRGVSLTDFVVAATSDAARRVIREHEVVELSEKDQAAFASVFLDPPKPNAKLRKAVLRH